MRKREEIRQGKKDEPAFTLSPNSLGNGGGAQGLSLKFGSEVLVGRKIERKREREKERKREREK